MSEAPVGALQEYTGVTQVLENVIVTFQIRRPAGLLPAILMLTSAITRIPRCLKQVAVHAYALSATRFDKVSASTAITDANESVVVYLAIIPGATGKCTKIKYRILVHIKPASRAMIELELGD